MNVSSPENQGVEEWELNGINKQVPEEFRALQRAIRRGGMQFVRGNGVLNEFVNFGTSRGNRILDIGCIVRPREMEGTSGKRSMTIGCRQVVVEIKADDLELIDDDRFVVGDIEAFVRIAVGNCFLFEEGCLERVAQQFLTLEGLEHITRAVENGSVKELAKTIVRSVWNIVFLNGRESL